MPFTPGAEHQPGAVCEQWATGEDVCAPCDDVDAAVLDASLEAASLVLFELTGRRWPGECEDVVFPTGRECLDWLGSGRHKRRALRLPGYPVTSVEEVIIDGEEIASDLYRVDDQRWLVYIPPVPYVAGDRQNWPIINNERLVDGSEGTWSVRYFYGNGPPPGGRQAAAALGCELAKSCTPDAEGCRLPERVTSITRQGITMAIIDPLTLFADGLTGLPEVDLWVSAMRLGVSRRPAGLMVPGRRSSVRRTTDAP
jgi:hypothetical protein